MLAQISEPNTAQEQFSAHVFNDCPISHSSLASLKQDGLLKLSHSTLKVTV